MTRRRDPDFDKSADMRLVALQRAALGVPAAERGTWQSSTQPEGSSVAEEQPPDLSSAVLAVEITATPAAGVIPGAIVTVALSIVNEGALVARDVRVAVPLPGGAAYRNGSFVHDGRSQLDDAADELFTTGAGIGEIAPGMRATFLWKIGVRLGNKPLVMTPLVSAKEAAVIGAQPAIVTRREGAQKTFAGEVLRAEPALREPEERPIYELDEEETIEYEAAESALSSSTSPRTEYQPGTEPPVAPSTPPPDQPEPAPPPGQPAPIQEPGVPATEPEMPVPPEQPPDIEPAATARVREAISLTATLDRPSVAYFDRMFNASKPPALLNHFILGGALACTRSPLGEDAAGLSAHLDAQSQLLQRIVLHEKLGKKEPVAEYAGKMLARVDAFAPVPVPDLRPPNDKNALLLYTELDGPTLAVLQKMQEESARWDFTKARQMTLALQARRVLANAPAQAVERANEALRAYAQTASMQLQRFFVRMRIDRTTGLLFAQDTALDVSARALIAALTALF